MQISKREDGRFEAGDRIFATEAEASAYVDGVAAASGRVAPPEPATAKKAPPPPEKKSTFWIWIVLIVAGVLFFAASKDEDAQARVAGQDSIAYCWQQQERKSLDPTTARLAAGACEKMEESYYQKHGVRP